MYRILFLGFFTMLLFSNCSKDVTIQENVDLDQFELDTRNANQWCDGGSEELPSEWITNVFPNGDDCCITLQTPFRIEKIQLVTTNYDFGTGTGRPQGNVENTLTTSSGEVTFCYDPEMGSHFLINFPNLGLCYVHEIITC
jgi:hypothetical protein